MKLFQTLFLLTLLVFVSIFDPQIATAGPLDPQVTLAVDPGIKVGYKLRIYERTGTLAAGFVFTLRGEAAAPTDITATPTVTLANVALGAHTWIARVWDGVSESVDSNAVTFSVAPPPSAPLNLRVVPTP